MLAIASGKHSSSSSDIERTKFPVRSKCKVRPLHVQFVPTSAALTGIITGWAKVARDWKFAGLSLFLLWEIWQRMLYRTVSLELAYIKIIQIDCAKAIAIKTTTPKRVVV